MGRRLRLPSFILFAFVVPGVFAPQEPTGIVTLNFEPQKLYIERRGVDQVVNFDLLVHNGGHPPLRINKIQISVYDAAGALALRRYLDENGRPSGISTLADRIVPAGGSLDVFNPFNCFDEETPLTRLHYEVFFERPDHEEPNVLSFVTKAEADVYPISYAGKTRLILPLKGRIYVFDGHDFYAHHRRQSVFFGNHFRPNRRALCLRLDGYQCFRRALSRRPIEEGRLVLIWQPGFRARYRDRR